MLLMMYTRSAADRVSRVVLMLHVYKVDKQQPYTKNFNFNKNINEPTGIMTFINTLPSS